MSITSAGDAGTEPITTPRGPLDPPEGVAWFKVLRRNEAANSWEAATIYEDSSRSHTPRHVIPDEPISEFILDHWGSGLYFCAWFNSQNRGRGRGKEIKLDDPRRPQRPLAFGGPAAAPAPAPATMAIAGAPAPAGAPLDLVAALTLLSQQPALATLLQGQQQHQPSQLELARLERERDRERREWEERRDRERREWEEERVRLRAAEERRAERERAAEEDRRRRDEEDHRARLAAERRRHELELQQASEASGGLDREDFEQMFDELRTELRKEIAEKEKSLLGQIFDVVGKVAPAFLPQIMAAMNGGARAPAPPAPLFPPAPPQPRPPA